MFDVKSYLKNLFFGILGALLGSIPGIVIYYISFYFNKPFSLFFILFIPLGISFGYLYCSKKYDKFVGDNSSILDTFIVAFIAFSIVYIINTFDVTNMLYKEYNNEFKYFELFFKLFPKIVDLPWISTRIVISEIIVILVVFRKYLRNMIIPISF